jgi:hypothetical protein
MLKELTAAIMVYKEKWDALTAATTDRVFFDSLQPTSVGWKTEDLADFNQCFDELRDASDQVHMGWVNERWIATFHLKDETLPMGLSVVKLMQRRPGSSDATGLDHLDFYFEPGDVRAKDVMANESFEWTEEVNGERCKWISIWFADTEAKVRSDTVLEVCAQEMKDVEKQILN